MIQRLLEEETGQGMVEYTFIVMLIAVAAVVGFLLIGTAADNNAENVAAQFPE